MYLSTKNINFAKGLARKLIPKYIGPYKILKDFNNQFFKIDLPSHLHNVFHALLLRIHSSNNGCLFPGWMDTQLGENPKVESKWAVNKILLHSRSGENSLFEIKWKASNVMWLPYYQIRHLQSLEAYLDLFGTSNIANLSTGKGSPCL